MLFLLFFWPGCRPSSRGASSISSRRPGESDRSRGRRHLDQHRARGLPRAIVESQRFFVFLFTAIMGASLIARDRRENGLSLYFSRPLRPARLRRRQGADRHGLVSRGYAGAGLAAVHLRLPCRARGDRDAGAALHAAAPAAVRSLQRRGDQPRAARVLLSRHAHNLRRRLVDRAVHRAPRRSAACSRWSVRAACRPSTSLGQFHNAGTLLFGGAAATGHLAVVQPASCASPGWRGRSWCCAARSDRWRWWCDRHRLPCASWPIASASWFGEVIAVGNCSLEVGAGVVGLLGQNGAGKTTLFKLLAGLITPSHGDVKLDGLSLRRDVGLYRRIGFCPESDALPGWMTGREFLAMMLRLQGAAPREVRGKVDALLERFDLTEAAGRRLGGYSKGMRQKLKLAQALAHDPRRAVHGRTAQRHGPREPRTRRSP